MKKILLLSACLAVLTSCDNSGKKDGTVDQEKDSLMQVIDQKDAELNEIMGTINEVQEGFRLINEAEGRIAVADGNPERAASRETIRENMAFIQDAMTQNRDMISRLKDKLRNSSINTEKLQKTIENLATQLEEQKQRIQELEVQLAEKDATIAQQGQAISNLNTDVNTLTQENQDKTKKVSEQDKQINTAWFVFGTKSELKEQKILKSGDVLKTNDFNKDYFTKIDIRYDKEIKLYSKSAKLLTNHPTGSYALNKDAKGQYVLQISDATQFWSVSKYLVVLVK